MVYRRSTLKVLLGPEGRTRFMDSPDDEGREEPARRYSGGPPPDTAGVCNLYKRTRPPRILQARPRLEKHHAGLKLAGQKMQRAGTVLKSLTDDLDCTEKPVSGRVSRLKNAKSLRSAPTPLATGLRLDVQPSRYSPTLHKPTPAAKVPEITSLSGNRVSDIFLNDFGLNSIHADTFAGYLSGQNIADFEKQMEEKATRHIRACQAIGDVKRNSLAQRSYHGLKDAVSPARRVSGHYIHDGLTRTLVREHSLLRPDSNRISDYIVHIRRPIGSISRTRNISAFSQSNNPLPEISCRTVILGSFDAM